MPAVRWAGGAHPCHPRTPAREVPLRAAPIQARTHRAPAQLTGRFRVIPLFLSTLFEAIMRLLSRMAVVIVSAWMGVHVNPAAAQSFEDRFSIIPKAHAEPSPEPGRPGEPAPQRQSPLAAEPTRGSGDRSATRSFKRSFSGKASFYSYRNGKTASGSLFDRNLPTAAHRSLPFGTRVRVIDLANNKSVIVTITDRGPNVPGRVLDLSLNAARTLGITDRGVAQVRAEVL
jgi:rare lipoprotein A (peptidoglycan hydrolase)